MSMTDQIRHYADKLSFEIDSWDLYEGLKNTKNIIVVDARSPDAYATEHIPGAINIPHRSMSAENTAHLDRAVQYICYCDGIGCNASTKGALNLARLGFKVKELLGGLDWWRRDGYATEGTDSSEGKGFQCGC